MNVFDVAVNTLFSDDNIGEDAIYTEPNGTPVTIRVAMTRDSQLIGEYGQVLENRITARLPSSIAPEIGARLQVAGMLYTVSSLLLDDSRMIEVVLR